MATEASRGRICLTSSTALRRKPPVRCKDFEDIFCTSWLIAVNYVKNDYFIGPGDEWSTDPEWVEQISDGCCTPEDDETRDDCDHCLDDVELCARQLGARGSLSSVLIQWRGRHVNVTTHVTHGDRSVASDDVKYTPVAVGEHDDWQSVVKQESDNRKRLRYNISVHCCSHLL